MYVKYKGLLPILFCMAITRVDSSGWKPIPPPRGVYTINSLSHKTPHALRMDSNPFNFKSHPIDDLRLDSLRTSLVGHTQELQVQGSPKLEENSFHKYTLEDIFPTPLGESFFTKEPVKSFKPTPTGYEEPSSVKRPAISFHNFNTFRGRKPYVKPLYYEAPKDVAAAAPLRPVEVKYKPFKPSLFDDSKYYYKLPTPTSVSSFSENDVHAGHGSAFFKPEGLGELGGGDGHCSLYKVSFRQDLYFQYIQYKTNIPDLKEFTLCMWNKFHNHSNDHPLFSYAVRHQPKAISMWVTNTDRSNYYTMAINGHTILRLNYPIRLNKWYHTCQSWNGKTGEWQVWVNAERIGRGFHNLLVGHVIPGGGLAISGQEQRQFGGGFLEGPGAPKGSGGFLGEITMVQLYKVALTAGKAYTDHRHHHSLFTSTTEEPPPLPPDEPPPPPHPFLENGQLKRPLKVFELAEALRTKGNAELSDTLPPTFTGMDFINTHFPNNYYGNIDTSAMNHFMQPADALSVLQIPDHALYKRNDGNEKKDEDRHKRTGDSAEGNQGENKEPSEKKVKFVSNPPSKVHVEKIKFPAKKGPAERSDMTEEEYDDWTGYGEKTERRKREANETSEFTEQFVTVDEDKDEPEESDRSGRMLMIRRKRPNSQPVHVRRVSRPAKRSPAGLSTELRAPVAHANRKKTTTKRQDEKEDEKDPAKRQILLGDPSLGFGSILPMSLLGNDYGLLHSMPMLGIPLQPLHADVPSEYGQTGGGGGGEETSDGGGETDNTPRTEEDDTAAAQPEPAEGEVRRIMAVCSGCELDPFRKVAVISWRSTPKKIYSGALFLKAQPECKRF